MLKYKDFVPGASITLQERFKGLNMSLADALPMGILITDAESRCVYSNAVYQRLCGWAANEIKGSYWCSVVHPEDHATVTRDWQKSLSTHSLFQCEARLKRADGEDVWTRRHIAAMHEGMPEHVYVHTVEDISAQKAREASKTRTEEKLIDDKVREQMMLDFICDGLICTDTGGHITYVNRMAEKLTGFSCEEALGLPLEEVFWVVDAHTREPREDLARYAMDSDCVVPLHNGVVLVNRNGMELAIEDSATPIHNRKREVTGSVIMFHDTRYSSETIAKMTHFAEHDPLTGLLNRYGFAERFDQSMALARRHNKQMGMLFIDLDNFKHINDTLGHSRADRILESLAKKLLSCVRASDTVCRHGGDEFLVLLNEIAEADHAVAVADKVREAVASERIMLDDKEVALRVSIGVSVYPDDGESLDALLRNADAAMYRIKISRKRDRSKAGSYTIASQQQQV